MPNYTEIKDAILKYGIKKKCEFERKDTFRVISECGNFEYLDILDVITHYSSCGLSYIYKDDLQDLAEGLSQEMLDRDIQHLIETASM